MNTDPTILDHLVSASGINRAEAAIEALQRPGTTQADAVDAGFRAGLAYLLHNGLVVAINREDWPEFLESPPQ